MAITTLQPFNLDITADYTFANVTAGNINGANLVNANYITGTLTTSSQPNITSVGTLTDLSVSNSVTVGSAPYGAISVTNSTGFSTTWSTAQQAAAWTVSFWVYIPTQSINYPRSLFYNGDDGSSQAVRVYLSWNGASLYTLQLENRIGGTGSNFTKTLTGPISQNAWHFVTVGYNGTDTVYLGLDGDVSSISGTAISSAYAGLAFGRGIGATGFVNTYGPQTYTDVALTLGTASYTSNFTPPTTHPTSAGKTLLLLAKTSGTYITNEVTGTNVSINGSPTFDSSNPIAPTGSITVAVSANLGNLVTANYFIGSGNNLSNIQGANVSGQVPNALIASTVYTNAQPNITSVGTLTDLNVSGNAIITGNLAVSGTVEYTNVNNLYIKDPIIEQGGGTNSAVLTTNDSKDRGSLLHYYTSAPVDAFMGWDNSNAEFAFGSNVSVTGEVVTFNSLGNVRVGNLLGPLANGNTNVNIPSSNGNINLTAVGNTTMVVTGTGANITGTANVTGNLSASNANLGNLLITNNLSVTSYVTSSLIPDANITYNLGSSTNRWKDLWLSNSTLYFDTDSTMAAGTITNGRSSISIPVANGNISITTDGNTSMVITSTGANITGTANITGNLSANNATLGNQVTANFFIGSGNNLSNIQGANVTGQVSNALVAGTVYSASQPNITSVGNLTSLAVGGAVTAVSFTANTYFAGNGNGLSNITGANVTGAVPYATTANAVAGANVSGAVAYATTANAVAGANVSGAVNYAITANNVAGANVTGQVSNSLVTGTVYTNAQPNITSLGTLTGLTGNGNINFTNASNVSLGAVGNIKITGGADGQFLQTDGSGILRWSAISADGLGVASITNGNSAVGIATANGNVTINVASNTTMIITSTGANITGTANITGNLRAGNANLGNAVSANYFVGTVYTATQPNITSVGTLTGLLSTGDINFTVASNISLGSVENVHITGGSSGQYLQTDGAGVLTWATIATSGGGTATISNGNSNINIAVADGNVNVSAVGNANVLVVTGTGINITGNVSADNANLGNLVTANYFTGTLTTASQPNITSVGTLTGITSTGTANFAGASNVSLGPVANVKISGGSSGYVLRTDGAGNLSWTAQASGGNGGGVGGSSIISGTTSVDIPSASGNINFTSDGNTIVVVSGTGANITGNLEVTGSNVSLGTVGNLKIAGGTPGQVLQTDGAGNLSWKTAGSGQGGTGFLYVYTRSQINATINVISRYVTIGRRSGNTQVVVS